jgi:hypothetical protein
MRLSSSLRSAFFLLALPGVMCFCLAAQDAQKDATPNESKGMPPRAAPTDYQAHEKAGAITIAAEFMGHSVPTPDAIYNSEEYVVVEVGVFGPPQARATLSNGDFSLRINGKKNPEPSQPFELVSRSLKDPEWGPTKSQQKSKTSLGAGGGGDEESTPTPPKMPPELKRTMEQRVQRTGMLQGDRPLPQAGLFFFEYRGKTQNIKSVELIYTGSAGTATVTLQP